MSSTRIIECLWCGVSVWLEGMGGMERNKNKEVRGFKEIGAKELL